MIKGFLGVLIISFVCENKYRKFSMSHFWYWKVENINKIDA